MEQLLHGDLGVVRKYHPHAHQGFVITTPWSDIPLSKGPLCSYRLHFKALNKTQRVTAAKCSQMSNNISLDH